MAAMSRLLPALMWAIGWAWAILAGGGGLVLLIQRGPWPLTNGWFALCSGIAACPLTAWAFKRYLGIALSVYVQIGVAVLFFIAGRIALVIQGR